VYTEKELEKGKEKTEGSEVTKIVRPLCEIYCANLLKMSFFYFAQYIVKKHFLLFLAQFLYLFFYFYDKEINIWINIEILTFITDIILSFSEKQK